MTDKQMYKELEKFGNQHPYAENIIVTISPHSTAMKPKDGIGMKYEYAQALTDIIRGAEQYLFWKRRQK